MVYFLLFIVSKVFKFILKVLKNGVILSVYHCLLNQTRFVPFFS
jgi:hypothetical protein